MLPDGEPVVDEAYVNEGLAKYPTDADFIRHMMSAIVLDYEKFPIGKAYLKAKYLTPLTRPLQETVPVEVKLVDERQAHATTLLRQWVCAEPGDRAAVYKRAKAFLSSENSLEDEVLAIQTKNPRTRVPQFQSESSGREFIRY